MTTIYTTKAYDTIDLICWKYYGRTEGTTEAVLEANYGLSCHQLFLPIGIDIILPETEKPKPKTIRLWNL